MKGIAAFGIVGKGASMDDRADSNRIAELGAETRAESNADLLLAVYATTHLTFVWYGIAYLLFGVAGALPEAGWAPVDGLPLVAALAGILGAYATLLRVPIFHDYQKRSRVLAADLAVLLAGSLALGGALLAGGAAAPYAAAAAGLVLGYAVGVAGLLALDFAIGFERGAFVVCLCASLVLGIIGYCLCSEFGPLCGLAVFAVLAVAGTAAAFAYSRRLLDIDNPEKMLTAQAFAKMSLNSQTGWFLLFYGIVVGLKSIELVVAAPRWEALAQLAGALGFVAGAAVSLFLLVRNPGNMLFGKAQRFAFPFLVMGLLPWGALGEAFAPLAFVWTFAACALFMAFVFDTHHFLSKKYAVPPLYPLVIGFRSFVKGLITGSVAAMVALAADPAAELVAGLSLALVVVLCFLIVLVREEPDRTAQETAIDASVAGPGRASAAAVAEGEGAGDPDAVADERPARRTGVWMGCCRAMADEASLTPREAEILALLLKANTTERISGILCISAHTTKTHIYHIYQKFDISSRSELADLFEARLEAAKRGG